MSGTWRLLLDDAPEGPENMAVDRALLDAIQAAATRGEPPATVLRLYAWRRATVSTGRHQHLEDACDLAACAAEGVDVVQRPTGGRAVLHDDEVTFAVVAPAQGRFAGAGVTAASAAIAEALHAGLVRLGAAVDVVRGAPGASPRGPRQACFASASRAELVVDGRKLCGSAQVRTPGALLQHGSLPLSFDPVRQGRLLGTDPAFLRERAVGLAEALGRRPEPGEVREALVAGFAAALGVVLEPARLTDEEARRAEDLAAALRADARRWLAAPRAAA